MSFVNLHLHTEYSARDSIIRISEVAKHVKEIGQNAVAITDHGTMGGIYKFNKACLEEGIKPILGLEAYYAFDRTLREIDHLDQRYYHLVLLAQNEIGLQNLITISSEGFRTGFYYKSRVDLSLLQEYSEGIICLSACLQSPLHKLLKLSNQGAAEEELQKLNETFPNRFFLEVQGHLIDDQIQYNHWLVEMSKKYNVPLVATCDCHYLKKEDGVTRDSVHEQALCMNHGSLLSDTNRMSYEGFELWVKSEEEIKDQLILGLIGVPEEAIHNTQHVADMCTGSYFNTIRDLSPRAIGVSNSQLEIERLAKWGLVQRFDNKVENIPQEYKDRMHYELKIINEFGFNDYFLVVRDFIVAAREKNIPVGPGRGSAAGSLVTWALGITGSQLDPIKHGLYFERFLNPSRAAKGEWPDLDIDFAKARRPEVFDYIKETYGNDHVCHIGTHQSMKPRGMMRNIGKVLGYDVHEQSLAARLIPEADAGKEPTMEEAIEASPQLLTQYPDITKTAQRLDRIVDNPGVHASGLIISREPLKGYIPLWKNSDYDYISEFDMKELEKLGLIKFDLLVIANLDVVERTLKLIEENHNVKTDIDAVPIDDELTFKMLCDGKTAGVFQLEEALTNVTTAVQPNCWEDLSVVVAIGRPGPLRAGLLDQYLQCKETGSPPEGMPYQLAEILKDTHYTMIYQEQVMRVCRELAGFSLEEAETMRKAIGKKIRSLMAELREQFVDGCNTIGVVTGDDASTLFDTIQGYALYSFNKAHSLAYAFIAYQEAYLKAHYPAEFFMALLTFDDDNEKISRYISEARDMGVKIHAPNINHSMFGFNNQDDVIYYGIKRIKNLGAVAGHSIIKARDRKKQTIPFTDIWDFCDRVDLRKVNKTALDALTKAGAFDCLGYDRESLLEQTKDIVRYYSDLAKYYERKEVAVLRQREIDYLNEHPEIIEQRREEAKQNGKRYIRPRPLSIPPYPTKPEISMGDRVRITPGMLELEREVLGCYITAHPTDFINPSGRMCRVNDLSLPGQRGIVGVVIIGKPKVIKTKNKKLMAFCTMEDATGRLDVVVFPKQYAKYKDLLEEGNLIILDCSVDKRPDRAAVTPRPVIADKMSLLER